MGFKSTLIYKWSYVTPGNPQAVLGTHVPICIGDTPGGPERCYRISGAPGRALGPREHPGGTAALTLKQGAVTPLRPPDDGNIPSKQRCRTQVALPAEGLRDSRAAGTQLAGPRAARRTVLSSPKSVSGDLKATQVFLHGPCL